jgi:cell division protein ZapE
MKDAVHYGEITARHGALIAYLEPILAARDDLDYAQAAALDRLQQLADSWSRFARPPVDAETLVCRRRCRGNLSLWRCGPGQSFLMDSFFVTVAIRRRTRVHFEFMRDVHEDLNTLKREPDPLIIVATRIARKWHNLLR